MRNRNIGAIVIAVTFLICTAYAILSISESELRMSKNSIILAGDATQTPGFSYPNVNTSGSGVRAGQSLLAMFGGPDAAYGVAVQGSAADFNTSASVADPRVAQISGRNVSPSSMRHSDSRSAMLITTAAAPVRASGVTPASTGAAPKRTTERMESDFSVMSALFHFNSDANTFRFTLAPENSSTGKATVYWDEEHYDALFTAVDLAPTPGSSRYVLWYIMEDGSLTWELAFRAVSGAHQSFFLKDAPTKGVKGALLTLEVPSAGSVAGKTVHVLSASKMIKFQPTAAATEGSSSSNVATNGQN